MLPPIEMTCGTHTEDDIVFMIIGGRLKLWVGKTCAAVTEFQEYPRLKVLNVFLCGGEKNAAISEAVDFFPALLEFARMNGCKRISCTGRKGWPSIFPGALEMGTASYMDL